MSGNWLKINVIGLCLALFPPAVAAAQDEASSRSTAATLDTVVVTATRQEEKLREVTSNVTVITEEMIKRSLASDMSQLMRQQGFDVSGSNAGGKQLRLRGMESPQMNASDISSRVLVLLNGRRIGGPNLDFIGLANVERIEVIRGPSAVQYGPSAMGGVVNIITKRGGEKPEIRAEAGAGSFDLQRYKLAASGQSPTGLVDFSFGTGHQYRGDYKTGDGWVWDYTRTGHQTGFNADVGLNLQDGHRFGVNYNYFGISGAECPFLEVSHTNPTRPINKPGSWGMTTHDVTNSNLALTYDGTTEDKAFNWQGRFSFGTYEDKFFNVSDIGYGDWEIDSKSTMDMKNLTAILGYDDGGIFALSGGLDYLVYEIDRSESSGNPGTHSSPVTTQPEYQDFGAFLSGKLRFLDDSLIFSAGGRFDSYKIDPYETGPINAFDPDSPDYKSLSKTNFSPSIGLAWLPVDWLKLRGNYSQGFRMPTPLELWGHYSTSYSIIENPELKPEKSKTWEIGLDASWEFFNASLTYFRSEWDDKILAGRSMGVGNNWQYTNLQGATIAGYELALSADLGQAFMQDYTLRPYINLAYMPTRRNKDHSGGPMSVDKLGFDTQPNTSKMTLSYGLDFVEPNIDLAVNVNATYAGKKKTQDWTDPAYLREMEASNYSAVAPWIDNTPGTIVDMSLEQGIWKFGDVGKLKVRAEVNNLFDKYDEGYISYPGPGRNYYVGLVYQY